MNRPAFIRLVTCMSLIVIGACKDSPSEPAPTATGLRIDPATISIPIGGTQQLNVVPLDAQGQPMTAPPHVAWISADSALAAVDATGLVRGRRPGVTSVTARVGALETTVPVTVVGPALEAEGGRAVTGVFGPDGGALEATSSTGVRYRLDIPRSALTEETMITLTPIRDVVNAPFITLLGAARFAPDGLELLAPARLTIELAATVNTGVPISGLTFGDDGSRMTPWPFTRDGSTVSVLVAHFSGAGVAEITDQDALYGVERDDVDIIFDIAGIAAEHTRTGVWDVDALITLFREWYTSIIEPGLNYTTEAAMFHALSEWRLWLGMMDYPEIGADLVLALGTEIAEARVLAAALLLARIDAANAECIREQAWPYALWILPIQRWAEDFELAEPGSGLDPATILAEICFQIHNVEIIFPENPVPGEAAELIVRPGIGYGGGAPVESGNTRTRVRPSGSMDDSETLTVAVEVIRAIVPTGTQDLSITIRSCLDIDYAPPGHIDLSTVCSEDVIVRSFPEEPEEEPLKLSGDWTLVVDDICAGTLSVYQQGATLVMSGSVGGGSCPFSASGDGTGTLEGLSIRFGIGFGGSSGTGFGPVEFDGTVSASGTFMSGSYTRASGGGGAWQATRK